MLSKAYNMHNHGSIVNIKMLMLVIFNLIKMMKLIKLEFKFGKFKTFVFYVKKKFEICLIFELMQQNTYRTFNNIANNLEFLICNI